MLSCFTYKNEKNTRPSKSLSSILEIQLISRFCSYFYTELDFSIRHSYLPSEKGRQGWGKKGVKLRLEYWTDGIYIKSAIYMVLSWFWLCVVLSPQTYTVPFGRRRHCQASCDWMVLSCQVAHYPL